MSITFLELSKELQGFANDLSGEERGVIMIKLASDALALLKRRVQEKGEDPNGNKYRPYSTKPTLIGRKTFVEQKVADQLLGSKDKRKKLDWVKVKGHNLAILPGGYKKIRDLQGRQTGFVDFTFTGRMLGNAKMTGDIKLISDRSELNSGVARIAPTQEIEKKKLSGNTERRGEILGLSKQEETILAGEYETWVGNLLRKRGLIT
jgi:hypothetical protein